MTKFLFAFSLGSLLTYIVYRKLGQTYTRRRWYTPSALVSNLLFEVARRAPNEAGIAIAALYGVVEVCGLRSTLSFAYRRLILPHLKKGK